MACNERPLVGLNLTRYHSKKLKTTVTSELKTNSLHINSICPSHIVEECTLHNRWNRDSAAVSLAPVSGYYRHASTATSDTLCENVSIWQSLRKQNFKVDVLTMRDRCRDIDRIVEHCLVDFRLRLV